MGRYEKQNMYNRSKEMPSIRPQQKEGSEIPLQKIVLEIEGKKWTVV